MKASWRGGMLSFADLMASQAPSSSPLSFPVTTTTVERSRPPLILPELTLGARIRSLLADRSRFPKFLLRESCGLMEAAEAVLGSPGGLAGPGAELQLERCLARAWKEQATLTAELCDSAITPLDGEDLRALACSLTAVIEALNDVQAAAGRISGSWEQPLGALCTATLEYIGAVCELMPEPRLLAIDPVRLGTLRNRAMAMRSARRACETALMADATIDAREWMARWGLMEEFWRLRTSLNVACGQLQRVVLKNS